MSSTAAVRAVLFDFDGVLTTDASGSLTTLRHLHHVTGLAYSDLQAAFAPAMAPLLLGHTGFDVAWPEICSRLGHAMPIEYLHAAFDSTPMNAPMLDLARRLGEHVRVGIITDNMRERVGRLVRLYALDSRFDPIVVSADVGAMKHDAAIFDHATRRLDTAPHQVVFIDNTPANLVAPGALGLHVEHFDDAANDVRGLEARLRDGYGLLRD